jgi:hypothetical protein
MPYCVPSSTILVTLMMEALRAFERSVFTSVTERYVPEEGILNSELFTGHYAFVLLYVDMCSPRSSSVRRHNQIPKRR